MQTYPTSRTSFPDQIEGPLVIEGSIIPGKDRSLKIAVTLLDRNQRSAAGARHPVDENTQVDKLNVYNDGSVSHNTACWPNPDNANGLEAIYEWPQASSTCPSSRTSPAWAWEARNWTKRTAAT